MNPRVAFPFLVLPDAAVSCSGWMLGTPGEPLVVPGDVLDNWDYDRDLEVAIELRVDFTLASQALQLPKEKLLLTAVLDVGTGTGNMPRRQTRLVVSQLSCEAESVTLTTVISGKTLSGRLRVGAQILFGGPSVGGSGLSPAQPGSRLWQSYQDILIEDGGDSRFPVETVRFSQWFAGLPQERAPWYLHWRPSALQADFSGCVRLYVNEESGGLAQRFAAGDPQTLQAIMGDVMSQMVSSVIDNDYGEELLEACEPGSVGHQIGGWVSMAFPNQALGTIRVMRDQFPGRFRAAILAAAEVGDRNE